MSYLSCTTLFSFLVTCTRHSRWSQMVQVPSQCCRPVRFGKQSRTSGHHRSIPFASVDAEKVQKSWTNSILNQPDLQCSFCMCCEAGEFADTTRVGSTLDRHVVNTSNEANRALTVGFAFTRCRHYALVTTLMKPFQHHTGSCNEIGG